MSWTLPQTFYDNLNPCYLLAFRTLEQDINNSNDEKQKIKHLEDFAQKFMMPYEAWKSLFEMKNGLGVRKTLVVANYGFFFDETLYTGDVSANMLIDTVASPEVLRHAVTKLVDKRQLQGLENCIKIPSMHLDNYLMYYEKYSSSPFNKALFEKNVENMKELCQQIKAAEDDDEKWIELITTVGDEKFTKINIENRLNHNLTNKKLWQLYIRFLKVNDPEEMLQVYSKYCRFFVCDTEMQEKYRRKLKKYGPITLRWENPFIFEKLFGCEPNRMYICQSYPYFDKYDLTKKPIARCRRYLFSTEYAKAELTPLRQENIMNILWYYPQALLAFKSPLMRYILFNSNGPVLSKLHYACKLFFLLRPILPCYRFVLNPYSNVSNGYLYLENSIQYSSSDLPKSDGKNIYIGTSLYAYNTNENMLSTFIKRKFYKCDAKHIEIKYQNLTEKEFDFLVGHGNVESCCLRDVKIWKSDNEQLTMEEILEKMPKLMFFE